MSEKKMAGVFLWSLGGPPYGDTEKIKNENLIVVAPFDGIPFSRCVFPNSMRGQAFDPEYAERVADDEFYASGNLSRAHFAMEIPVEEYDTEDYPWWAITPGGFNLLVLPLMLATPSLEVIAAVEKMRAENGGENWLAKMKTENKAEVEKKFGFDPGRIQNRWKDKGRGIPESTTMPEPVEVSSPEVSSPSPVSPLKTLHELDTAAGRVAIVEPESAVVPCALPSPSFVAVPLPDDGKPVLDYCRKPGWYLTRGAGAVDVTYNVGTGVSQQDFPWVSLDSEPDNEYKSDTFYDVNGRAWCYTGEDRRFERDTYFDIIVKYENPAAETKEAGTATANDVPDRPVEYRLLEEGEVIQEGDEVDCCVNPMKDDAKWLKVAESMIGKTAPDPAYPSHSLFRRKVEKDSEPKEQEANASDPASCKVDESELRRLFHERTMKEGSCGCGTCFGVAKPYLVEVVKLQSSLEKKWDWLVKENHQLAESCREREILAAEACRDRDRMGMKFGTVADQRDVAWEALARAEKDVYDVKATLGKRDAECDNLRREVERLNAEFTPRDNGDGTVTVLSPVTWVAPLIDGVWTASKETVTTDDGSVVFTWAFTGRLIRGLSKPVKLGRYRFKNGIGTLIEESRKEGSE